MDGFGNLFVNNIFAQNVTEYAPPYTGSPIATLSTGVRFATDMKFDAVGNLFIAGQGSTILVYAPPYTGSPTIVSSGLSSPEDIAIDGAGNLFVTNIGN